MKFLLDENVDHRIASFLVNSSHDVTIISRDDPIGLNDSEVLSIATKEKRVLITNDSDFGELIYHQQYAHYGVIFFRFKHLDLDIKIRIKKLQEVLTDYKEHLQSFIVVTHEKIKICR